VYDDIHGHFEVITGQRHSCIRILQLSEIENELIWKMTFEDVISDSAKADS